MRVLKMILILMILATASTVSNGGEEIESRTVSFSKEVFPIILTKCSNMECHGNKRTPIFLTHKTISKYSTRIKKRLVDPKEPMPPITSQLKLTRNETIAILLWIKQGSPNN